MAFGNSIAVLDVGHGNCTVVHDAGEVIVVDAGRRSGLLEFLVSENIERIRAMIVSHADADHIGGLVAVLSSGLFLIEEVRLNTDSAKDSDLWNDVLLLVEQRRKDGELHFRPSMTVEDSGEFDLGNVGIEVLGPSPYLAAKGPGARDKNGRRISHNTISAVIRITHRGEPVALLTGDLDDVGLENLIAEELDATAPILVFPHHGGNPGTGDLESFTERILTLVSPSTVIFSIGRNAAYQFPRPDVVTRVKAHKADIRIICTQLSKHCASAVPRHTPSHLMGFSIGSERRTCCGGTIIVPLDNVAALTPDTAMHRAFIREVAPTALCAD